MEDLRSAIANACERLIWLVIDNDLDRSVRIEINEVVEMLKGSIYK